MKKACLFLCLCILICSGCSRKSGEDAISLNNNQNNSISNEDIPSEDFDTAAKNVDSIESKDEIENNDFITASIDVLSSSELVISYKNETENLINFGKAHILQMQDGENWVELSTLPNVGWTDILLNLNPGETFKEEMDLKALYGELKAGHYRVIKEMFMDSSKINVTVEFDIEE